MSQYYKPNRNPDWNYGGKQFRLSRSKIDLFVECPKCFYLDTKLGVARPPGFPLTLNIAVDELLKKEFDIHRAAQTAHPIMKRYGISAVPFQNPNMDKWRDSLRYGVEYLHPKTGLSVRGGVDDIWVNTEGHLIVVDYKATSKKDTPTLDGDLGAQYKRQMEVYQWLLRKNGFTVSNIGYFVYVNGKKDREAFDGKLEFDVTLLPCEGDDSWVDKTLEQIKICLDDNLIPSTGPSCDYCSYRNAVEKVVNDATKPQKRLL